MHSSRMRTVRRFTISGQEGYMSKEEGLPAHGIVGRQTPLPCEQTGTCENITFPQLCFAGCRDVLA